MLPGPLEQNIRNGQVHPEPAATAVSHQTLTPDKQQLWKGTWVSSLPLPHLSPL